MSINEIDELKVTIERLINIVQSLQEEVLVIGAVVLDRGYEQPEDLLPGETQVYSTDGEMERV